ncbi:deoxyuridine 5'-triphosphate nucleotidohydrolase, mitochondrial isoform X1 [Coturnix japonica]|uniref:deoxyuridine 5'-triphosphate nucleotidohydrolase, mitochondrial isoform X1 n=1 Tax=Coturnix japonica TaxID=93934 RepID=UPI000776EB63|nr:deoxyuridine 5'-triphosphate nucleotidohydrolase, mitochondrial isoform X1 [Coturnix japonica]
MAAAMRAASSLTQQLRLRERTMPCSEAALQPSPSKRQKGSAAGEPTALLRFTKLSENACAPSKGSARAAGYDLYSAYDYVIPPMEKAVVKTDIQIALPSGCYGRVAPRSGLAAKHFIDVGAGVIDEDYRGNVGVVLFNFGKETFEVKKGDRIAQLICERIFYPELEEVQALDDTERGEGGFGSTGKN